ncbi:MAG TPA: carboxylating nicotinate-nucleotide diphosphorylase [Balneolaceae bacterium]
MKIKPTEEKALKELISRAFDEDIQSGDATTNAVIDESTQAHARWIAKEQGIVAGLDAARAVFQSLDPELEWILKVKDGEEVKPGMEIVAMRGACRAILTAERTALNIVQRISGIATKTRKMVKEIEGYQAKILDTRKTAPGLRVLDKYAVKMGGGTNHRMGLYDLAMIKDNHIVAAGGIKKAVDFVRKYHPGLKVEVEVTSLAEVKEALNADADIIMLDNMSLELMTEAVSLVDGKSKTEASGNISFENLKEVAETGVDFISVGALTHSVKAFDISQQLQQI